MRLVRSSAGDTIIEVMLAFSVFAMLAVGAISIMNQGVANAQEALETTLVRQQIDGQAEALRFLHQAYMTDPAKATSPGTAAQKFQAVLDDNVTLNASPTKFGGPCLASIPQNTAVGSKPPFVIDPRTGTKIDTLHAMDSPTAPAFAQLQYDSAIPSPYGMWVEAVKGAEVVGQPSFIDFHIRACWFSVTGDADNPRTLGTIVRLYVPA